MLEYGEVKEAADFIAARIGEAPEVGVILGTGLAGAVSSIEVEAEIPYGDVPHMRESTNPVHPGRFVIGTLFGRRTICMQGRIHAYEGYEASEVAFPVFVMKLLGVRTIILTNAAGAINEAFEVQRFALISDHINFTGKNPLPLDIDPRLGVPCPDMTRAYSPELRAKIKAAAPASGEALEEGVYIGVLGPSFETPAEIRAFRMLGADLVGMSTIPEVIAAASAGIELVGISLITNMAAGITGEAISADDINTLRDDVPSRLAELMKAALS